MTKNQRIVLRWLTDNCSASGVVRVSANELSLSFGWSRQYTRKILNQLVDYGFLSVLRQGIGRGATKFRLLSPSKVARFIATTKDGNLSSPQVHSDNQKRVTPFRLFKEHKEEHNAYPSMRTHMQNVFDNVAINVYKPVRAGNSPFKRFRLHCDVVEKWTGPDFVCYFSYVYKVRFGEMPKLEWGKDIGAARLLRKRLGDDPLVLKGYIQIAMSLCKRPPDGLHTFSYGRTYQDIKEMEVPEEILDEYDDDYVFPWRWEKVKKESVREAEEYRSKLARRAFGIYD